MSIHDYPLLPGFPIPSDRDSLQHEIHEMEKEYHEKYLNDVEFHTRSRMIGNLLEQLASAGEDGDRQRTGFLVAALMDRHNPDRDLQAKLLAADSALTEAAVGYEGTAWRMCNEALLPKAQRDPDFDHDDMVRYGHFATMARSSLNRFKQAAGLRG